MKTMRTFEEFDFKNIFNRKEDKKEKENWDFDDAHVAEPEPEEPKKDDEYFDKLFDKIKNSFDPDKLNEFGIGDLGYSIGKYLILVRRHWQQSGAAVLRGRHIIHNDKQNYDIFVKTHGRTFEISVSKEKKKKLFYFLKDKCESKRIDFEEDIKRKLLEERLKYKK